MIAEWGGSAGTWCGGRHARANLAWIMARGNGGASRLGRVAKHLAPTATGHEGAHSTRHDDVARRRGRGEGLTTGRGPVEAKRWGSEKGVGKYDG